MSTELTLSTGTLFAFLLVLARVSGALTFVPLPGLSSVPGPGRLFLALGFTFCLTSRWPVVDVSAMTPFRLLAWAAAEAVIGLAIGVAVAVSLEAFTFAAQVLGLPAGYGYASTVDPNTQADSGILLVLAQLAAGLLFFALGLDREVLKLFAQTLDRIPAGAYIFGPNAARALVRLASILFTAGVRLALPIVALLAMVDVALALLGRLNAQLQLLSLAFPVKMLVALAILAWLLALHPRILMEVFGQAMAGARRVLGL
jgi:flagellar biosynthetic protein FliR